jgi:transcriptional regulator with XRE-family HTH domain
MEVYERINQLIKNQNLTKREFANKLISLEPKLNSTGETPTEKTIYKYLNGTVSIRIELIPYIAEALRVTEQDLFTHNTKSRKKFF